MGSSSNRTNSIAAPSSTSPSGQSNSMLLPSFTPPPPPPPPQQQQPVSGHKRPTELELSISAHSPTKPRPRKDEEDNGSVLKEFLLDDDPDEEEDRQFWESLREEYRLPPLHPPGHGQKPSSTSYSGFGAVQDSSSILLPSFTLPPPPQQPPPPPISGHNQATTTEPQLSISAHSPTTPRPRKAEDNVTILKEYILDADEDDDDDFWDSLREEYGLPPLHPPEHGKQRSSISSSGIGVIIQDSASVTAQTPQVFYQSTSTAIRAVVYKLIQVLGQVCSSENQKRLHSIWFVRFLKGCCFLNAAVRYLHVEMDADYRFFESRIEISKKRKRLEWYRVDDDDNAQNEEAKAEEEGGSGEEERKEDEGYLMGNGEGDEGEAEEGGGSGKEEREEDEGYLVGDGDGDEAEAEEGGGSGEEVREEDEGYLVGDGDGDEAEGEAEEGGGSGEEEREEDEGYLVGDGDGDEGEAEEGGGSGEEEREEDEGYLVGDGDGDGDGDEGEAEEGGGSGEEVREDDEGYLVGDGDGDEAEAEEGGGSGEEEKKASALDVETELDFLIDKFAFPALFEALKAIARVCRPLETGCRNILSRDQLIHTLVISEDLEVLLRCLQTLVLPDGRSGNVSDDKIMLGDTLSKVIMRGLVKLGHMATSHDPLAIIRLKATVMIQRTIIACVLKVTHQFEVMRRTRTTRKPTSASATTTEEEKEEEEIVFEAAKQDLTKAVSSLTRTAEEISKGEGVITEDPEALASILNELSTMMEAREVLSRD